MEFQTIKLSFYSILFQYFSTEFLMVVCLAAAIFFLLMISAGYKSKLKVAFVVTVTAISSYLGARVLHVAIENPDLLHRPDEILHRFDGMTFNGSLLFGLISFWLGLKLFLPAERPKYWDAAAVVAAFSYGLIRIGCFSAGCCWGKVSSVPWSVKYTESPVMPWLGIPVHPVQLYDSFLGFTIFFTLLVFRSNIHRLRGHLFSIFLVLYAIGRFVTELFRGDSFRGEDLLIGMSTSQLVSVALITLIGVIYSPVPQLLRRSRNAVMALATLIFVTGCLPQPPADDDFENVRRGENFEIFQTTKSRTLKRKNVLFVAADDNIQKGFGNILKAAYRTDRPPLLEDLVFWQYTRNLRDIYNVIVRIPPGKVGFVALNEALSHMESLRQPYDLILLTHGMPNHLSTGSGYFFSYRELAELKGRLQNLHLVLLQSCFGRSLAPDFKAAGAHWVMSYEGLNRNFFFFGFFLKYYYPGTSVRTAYRLAKENLDFNMGTSPYGQIASIFISQMNEMRETQGLPKMTFDEYLASMPIPVLE